MKSFWNVGLCVRVDILDGCVRCLSFLGRPGPRLNSVCCGEADGIKEDDESDDGINEDDESEDDINEDDESNDGINEVEGADDIKGDDGINEDDEIGSGAFPKCSSES